MSEVVEMKNSVSLKLEKCSRHDSDTDFGIQKEKS